MKFRVFYFFTSVAVIVGSGHPAGAVDASNESPRPEALLDVLPERALPGLQEFLNYGLGHASAISQREWELATAEQNIRRARAPMLPNANVDASVGMINERYNGYIQRNRQVAAVLYGAQLTQPVFHWGALAKSHRAARLQRTISARNAGEARRLFALNARRAYFDLIISGNAVAIQREAFERLKKDHAFQQQQLERGFVSRDHVTVLARKVEDADLQLRRSSLNYETQQNAFRRLVGLPDSYVLEVPSEVPAVPVDVQPMLDGLEDGEIPAASAALLNADDAIRAERLNYEVAKVGLRPKFGLRTSVTQDNRSPDNDSLGQKLLVTTWGTYLTAHWNLFDGYRTSAAKKSSLNRIRQLTADRELQERAYRESLHNDAEKLRFSWDSLRKAERTLREARSYVNYSSKEYDEGRISAEKLETYRTAAESALQSANSARADFYMLLATYLSNRGKDPALKPPAAS